jgi:hypothetical protein
MSPRAVAGLAWLLCGASLTLGVLGLVLESLNGHRITDSLVVVIAQLAITFPLVGAVVAARQPRNPLGWRTASGCATRSTWTRCRPSCWRWSTRACSQLGSRCGYDHRRIPPGPHLADLLPKPIGSTDPHIRPCNQDPLVKTSGTAHFAAPVSDLDASAACARHSPPRSAGVAVAAAVGRRPGLVTSARSPCSLLPNGSQPARLAPAR